MLLFRNIGNTVVSLKHIAGDAHNRDGRHSDRKSLRRGKCETWDLTRRMRAAVNKTNKSSSLRAERRHPRATQSALQRIAKSIHRGWAVRRIRGAQTRRLKLLLPAINEPVPFCRRRILHTVLSPSVETLSVGPFLLARYARKPRDSAAIASLSTSQNTGRSVDLAIRGPHSCPRR